VRSAEEFHVASAYRFVLTKMDGDARGGAALSIKQVTGQPVKFVRVGEKYDALEPFYPDRVASDPRQWAMCCSLIEHGPGQNRSNRIAEATREVQRNQFSLDEFSFANRQARKKLGFFLKF